MTEMLSAGEDGLPHVIPVDIQDPDALKQPSHELPVLEAAQEHELPPGDVSYLHDRTVRGREPYSEGAVIGSLALRALFGSAEPASRVLVTQAARHKRRAQRV